jgi:hypothetical protein
LLSALEDYKEGYKMSHKNNKNSKDNKKAGQKSKKELDKMRMETANEIGVSKESKKLGNETE